jgi:hydroxymethylpyrimidine/phosphomethylpyrimidine kinase
MGPHQCGALLVVTSINSETPQRVAQKLLVPRHMLSQAMQQLHQNGIPVTKVGTLEGSNSASAVATQLAADPGESPKAGRQSPRRRK